jgi:hypothetical protein
MSAAMPRGEEAFREIIKTYVSIAMRTCLERLSASGLAEQAKAHRDEIVEDLKIRVMDGTKVLVRASWGRPDAGLSNPWFRFYIGTSAVITGIALADKWAARLQSKAQ